MYRSRVNPTVEFLTLEALAAAQAAAAPGDPTAFYIEHVDPDSDVDTVETIE
jgi:hypothetical protein